MFYLFNQTFIIQRIQHNTITFIDFMIKNIIPDGLERNRISYNYLL